MKRLIKKFTQHFSVGAAPSIILFASPRGGSTWVTELIASQSGFWPVSEPLNVRSPWVRQHLGISTFADLYGDAATPKLHEYYSNILSGAYADLKLRPGLRFYRLITNRIIIKQNQGCLDRIDWFEDTFGVKVVHLLRHPIPVALSREEFPLLAGFHHCALRSHFSSDELELADRLIESGSHLEQGVLAWCLHHVPALKATRPSWLTVTYEETVLNPQGVIKRMVAALALEDEAAMSEQIDKPSQVMRKSNQETQALLQSGGSRAYLIEKWRSKISSEELEGVQMILDTFSVTLYAADRVKPMGRDVK